jgi:hypothetical protein
MRLVPTVVEPGDRYGVEGEEVEGKDLRLRSLGAVFRQVRGASRSGTAGATEGPNWKLQIRLAGIPSSAT